MRHGRGQVDVLIGIDHAYMHTGLTKHANHLVARKSPLGWVIFGSAQGDVSARTASMFHIRFSTPVVLTDFWTAESMGVQVDQCVCNENKFYQINWEEMKLIEESAVKVSKQWMIPNPEDLPDNKEHVKKLPESTEYKLLKNPQKAAAYNDKMKEMEAMKFTRKLTESEMEDYKGPVHYIPHHVVFRLESTSTLVRIMFNSSSSYKGPDLLNDHFGVILCFRENDVAIAADKNVSPSTHSYKRQACPKIPFEEFGS